jgi:hypothetical protein
MEDLKERFDVMMTKFQEDKNAIALLQKQLSIIKTWISENTEDEPEERPDRIIDPIEDYNNIESSRSIFDDIDISNE